jgi:hypothetical protein
MLSIYDLLERAVEHVIWAIGGVLFGTIVGVALYYAIVAVGEVIAWLG